MGHVHWMSGVMGLSFLEGATLAALGLSQSDSTPALQCVIKELVPA